MSETKTVSMDSLNATLRRITLPMGLVLDSLKIESGAARIQTAPFEISLDRAGRVEAVVAALDLAAFLNEKAPGGLKDFAIAIREGKLYIEATARVIVEVRAKAVCTLRIHEGRQLFVDLELVDVMGMGAKGMVQSHLDQINPVLDAAELPLDLNLEGVIADHDRLVVKGSALPKG